VPSLKEFRNRIASVKSTQKITSAMKMVAAAKLRRAQEQAEASRPYADRMGRMLGSLAKSVEGSPGAPKLLAGNGKSDTYLVIVATADRGLCGGFNSSIVREARRRVDRLLGEGKTVKILCLGRKGRDQLRRFHGDKIIDTVEDLNRPYVRFEPAAEVANRVARLFDEGEFDICLLFYAQFKSAISQIVTEQQLIPFSAEADEELAEAEAPAAIKSGAVYEYEPNEEQILKELLPRNLAVQVFKALLENNASEHGARMTAMDNATRNAGDMIDKLTLRYNRQRQSVVTNELIEIISAKEAL
jgi:F-type H+-transporting ATPase subunit gamma